MLPVTDRMEFPSTKYELVKIFLINSLDWSLHSCDPGQQKTFPFAVVLLTTSSLYSRFDVLQRNNFQSFSKKKVIAKAVVEGRNKMETVASIYERLVCVEGGK